VTYANGNTIVANARPETLHWNGIEIPQYGWAAKGNGVLAYTALRNAGWLTTPKRAIPISLTSATCPPPKPPEPLLGPR
jgi:hypothetical protein